MSGHSKWSTIKRQKGAADIKRGMTFTKIANAITIASKLGASGDPDANPRLRVAIDQARSVNMPKENIQRAIDRGLGKLPGQVLEEVIYEGFGPGKVAFLIEGVTDNKMRTLHEIRNLFERSGGTLAGSGATAHMFTLVGEFKIAAKGHLREEEILDLIDLGVQDIEETQEEGIKKYIVTVKNSELNSMSKLFTQKGYKIESFGLSQIPTVTVEIKDREVTKKVLEFAQKLEELDDLQKVYANFEIPDQTIENLN